MAAGLLRVKDLNGPCPFLEFDGGRAWCGVVRNPAKYFGLPDKHSKVLTDFVQKAIGAGLGCCSQTEEELETK